MPRVNPEILTWARETAGLDLAEAASALQIGGKKQSGAQRLQQYEEGTDEPSRPLLLRMVKVYRRPLLTFYLSRPPLTADRGGDFRTLPAEQRSESAAPLDALVRDVHVRQRLLRSALEDADEARDLPFVGSVSVQDDLFAVCDRIKKAINFDLDAFRRKRTVADAFGYLRNLVEQTGVFVLLIGNLGSHHSSISAEVFRGYALADKVAPFVVINDQDAKAAWSFTLLHELVHIWLGVTGVSGGLFEQQVERFCNDVASEMLLPRAEVARFSIESDRIEDLVDAIGRLATERRLSRTMVAYRLYQNGQFPIETWRALAAEFRRLWVGERMADRLRGDDASGPSYYVVRRHRVGGALIDVVRRTLAEGLLTPTKAGKVLGVKAINVEPLLATGQG